MSFKMKQSKIMNKTNKKERSDFEIFLKESLSSMQFDNMPSTLNISKKMFTCILKNPKKLDLKKVIILSKLTNQPLESITHFIEA
jgi:hypothetical protein